MIRVKVDRGNVDIEEIRGNGYTLMSEACCLVRAICISFAEEFENSDKLARDMVLKVSDALRIVEEK